MRRTNFLETLAIIGGVVAGAILFAAVWIFLLSEPLFAALFGRGYYFADSIMFLLFPLSILTAAALGSFLIAALFDYALHHGRNAAPAEPVNWRAITAGVLGLLAGILLAYGYYATFTPIGRDAWVVGVIPLVTLTLFVLAYRVIAARTAS